jgi:aryl carrier-like protein
MIGQAKAISHGVNLISYISGETANKKHPEDIHHVEDRFLPEGLDAQGIFDMMKLRCKLRNNVIRIELSPAAEYTRNFTMEDWRDLWHEFIAEFDKQELKNKQGKVFSYKTNLAGSRSSCWLHLDSKSGIPHLHVAVCRCDEEGKTNNDHGIHLRVQRATEAIALKRGWTTAQEKHVDNLARVNADITDVLKTMPKWDWNDFEQRLVSLGYWVHTNPDKNGQIHGYSLQKGNTRYKASQLGVGRNFMYTKLEATWKSLHPELAQKTVTPDYPSPIASRVEKYSQWDWNATRHDILLGGQPHTVYLPEDIEKVLQDEIDSRTYRDWDDAQNLAVALFLGAIMTKDVAVSGGGGGGNDRGWRDPKDEDEREWMRRCAHFALSRHGRKKSSGRSI